VSQGLAGKLLIASPQMGDWFERAVVLVVEHSDEGAFGLVLNNPSESTVGDAAPGLSEVIGEEHVIHLGGPVAPDSVTAIGEHLDPADSAKLVFGGVGMVDLERPPALARVRVFAGYAGWSAGQLDNEIESEAWIVEEAQTDDLFAEQEEIDLWAEVLNRMGGVYPLLARMPADPSLN
jgi:putative transcriptional regulator